MKVSRLRRLAIVKSGLHADTFQEKFTLCLEKKRLSRLGQKLQRLVKRG